MTDNDTVIRPVADAEMDKLAMNPGYLPSTARDVPNLDHRRTQAIARTRSMRKPAKGSERRGTERTTRPLAVGQLLHGGRRHVPLVHRGVPVVRRSNAYEPPG